ncbi:hypothetical protein H2200_008150 [Cladophialophora chaetospira]|uniref:Uncharacterized protein n=1 Tax=Cladophialophora chaetospira TaxID=386627 RepID=A0AA38X584_9EURO|nr:hypothetical protein H2200_008150 [Cladophialophora chaetospira]
MGVCLSCLGLGGQSQDDADRQRLLYDDYPSTQHYGTWGAGTTIPPENLMSQEEIQREQSALDTISRGLSDHIVEIFPHSLGRSLAMSTSQVNGNGHSETNDAPSSSQHQDILLSLIPGDKSKRSIRIYPASRPTSKSGQSLRSKSSVTGGLNGANGRKRGDSSVLVTLDVNLP